MLSPEFRRILAPAKRNLTIMWGAFMAACFIYSFIAWTVTRSVKPPAPRVDSEFLAIAIVCSAVVLAASVLVERFLLRPQRLEACVQHPVAPAALYPQLNGPATQSKYPELDRLFEELAPSEQHLAGLKAPYQTAQIVVWTMRESVAVMGFVLVILGGDLTAMLPFAAVALAAIALQPPRLEAFLERNIDLARKHT